MVRPSGASDSGRLSDDPGNSGPHAERSARGPSWTGDTLRESHGPRDRRGLWVGAALAAELRSRQATVLTTDIEGEFDHRLDVRHQDDWQRVLSDTGVPDFLFANAGISMGGPTQELTRAHWDRIIDVNLNGVVNGLLAVYPAMVERGSGHIVITASGAGLAAPPFVTAYAATKHAVVGLGLGLRSEAALHGVRVSILCPGAVDTPILDRSPPSDLPNTRSKPVTARQYLSLLNQKPVSADRFARLALDRIARDQAIICVPVAAKSLWYLHRLSPSLVARVSKLIAQRVDHHLLGGGN
ncbi:MAG TPA: SDR family NAD(P)-dependent oxidoreductase [Microthrixaceae bacterium]|nr:SDR family NAD(P)-dependent oxidoreductase [Microthrixaceae bacterium]